SPTDPIPDSIVFKFNPNGSLAYRVDVTTLEGIGHEQPGGGPNGGTSSITTDSAGNAFVLQEFDQTGPAHTGSVLSVLKLDPSGKELFATRYNGASDESVRDGAVGFAVTPAGDFYVTGNESPATPSNQVEIVTIKYDNAGVRQWLAKFPSAGAKAMALSPGSVVVTGNNATNWVTIAYVP